MKFIKSNSINFSKFCNFDEISEDANPGDEIDRILAGSQSDSDSNLDSEVESDEPVATQPVATPYDDTLRRFELNNKIKAEQAKLALNQRNLDKENRLSDLTAANRKLDATPYTLNKEDTYHGGMKALRGDDVDEHYQKMTDRSQYGDVVDKIASPVLSVGKGIASAAGNALSQFDTTKNAGESLKQKAAKFDPEYAGTTVGNWADDHKIASGAIGAGALLGAGILAKKGYDLMKGKKELQADAYYAFEGSEIDKNSLIGGPYSTRKDAREAHPEASHILKGSTLSAYGDFKIA